MTYSESFQDRFWRNVKRPPVEDSKPCWEWQASTRKGSYGQIWSDPDPETGEKTLLSAHRVAWEILNGPVPEGMVLLHSCDNPKCCNPHHLTASTQAANMRDMKRKGRDTGSKTRFKGGSIW
jgi:hypothetical protein